MNQQAVQLIKKPVQKQVQQVKPTIINRQKSKILATSSESQSKAIIFDSGALISFSMNGITYLIKELKSIFKGKFLITAEIKHEIIDRPLTIKRFGLEALKLKQLLDEGILEMPSSIGIKDSEIERRDKEILRIANSTFKGRGKDVHLLDHGEASCLALSRILSEKKIKNVIAVDERTTRMLVEKPENLKKIFEKKMSTQIAIRRENLKFFKGFQIIRSPELVYVAYKKGLTKLKNRNVLDALLWAVKFKGAAISGDEIEQIKKLG